MIVIMSIDINKMLSIFISFIFMSSLYLVNIEISKALFSDETDIIYVGGSGVGNYSKIQDAINNASDGNIIYVFSGYYPENIVIDKKIKLIGENKYDTTLDGCRKNDTLTIVSEGVKISGFTVKNSSYEKSKWWKAGIRVVKSDVTISNNIIMDNMLGVYCKQTLNLTIIDNVFHGDGIVFYPYDNYDSTRPILEKKYFIHNIKNNTVNGKSLLYYVDINDYEIPADIGQLIAVGCNDIRIRNTSFINTDFMVILVDCSNCLIENSYFSENDGELSLLGCNDNVIRNNTISNNFHGLLLDYKSTGNLVINNHFSNNLFCGVICEYFSNKNYIYNNDFVNNFKNAYLIQSFRNKWLNNYWDNWIGFEYTIFSFLPKLIVGRINNEHNKIPLINFDLNPVNTPYFPEIS